MKEPVSPKDQRGVVDRLMAACGGSYPPEIRRKFFISNPQWAAAYQGQALFQTATRAPVQPAEVIEHLAEIGIGWWATHDTDIIPTHELLTDRQDEILEGIRTALKRNGVQCSMVTGETFYHPVWAASPAENSRKFAPMRGIILRTLWR